MSTSPSSIIIVGAGLFGLTAAIELRRREWQVSVIDPGPLPRPEAASTDISKVVRADYGSDELYTALGEESLAGWTAWNQDWGETLYHEDGFLVMSAGAPLPGGFEHESYHLLSQRGFELQELDANEINRRFPAWTKDRYQSGYLNPRAGWVESGKVISRLVRQARDNGVVIRERSPFHRMMDHGFKVSGVITESGERIEADVTLLAAGAWTPTLLPELKPFMRATRQAVVCLKVNDLERYTAPRFPVWAADMATTGWYGFPALPDGTLKIARHLPGVEVHPDDPREVLPEEVEEIRQFVAENLPELKDAPVIGTRLCLYSQTFDGHFWIDRHPQKEGLVVASGDSGHAFKFAPVMGRVIADAVEQKETQIDRFRWREYKQN